jgi:hypothetical protein
MLGDVCAHVLAQVRIGPPVDPHPGLDPVNDDRGQFLAARLKRAGDQLGADCVTGRSHASDCMPITTAAARD